MANDGNEEAMTDPALPMDRSPNRLITEASPYLLQHAPSGSAPAPVITFQDRLRWWTWGRWKRRKVILAARDRFQQDIWDIKKRS